MEASPLGAAAERVRTVIRRDVRSGFSALVDFANANALTPKLRHEALLLKFEQREVTAPDELRALEVQMYDLLERIEADHADKFDGAEAASRQSRLLELRAQLLDQPSLKNPVFVGRDLGKSYSKFRLSGVNLELMPGEVSAVVGQNANGKTTLLRIVAGELRADQGTLEYPLLSSGTRLDWAKIKSRIAYLPQDLPAWQGSLADNLHYEAALHGILGADNDQEVEFFVERMGLREHLSKRWSELSGGFKLRFALARVLIWKPRLLVLDEPLANLDVLAQSRLLQDLLDLARSPRHPIAVLMSSQHLHELEAVASSLTFLRAGQPVFSGPMSEIGADHGYKLYELGTPSSPELLKGLFDDPRFEEPYHNGVSYVIKTGMELDKATLLRRLLDAGIDVTYFRDISRSIKSLFE